MVADQFKGPQVLKVESRRMAELDPGTYFEWHPKTGGAVYVIRPTMQSGLAKRARGWKIGETSKQDVVRQIIAAYAVGFAQGKNGAESEPEA